MELTAIPGVGEKTAQALAELDDPETAIRHGDVARLASAPGITAGTAARIAREAIKVEHGVSGEFLGTDRAQQIYDDVQSLLCELAVTDYGARRLETLFPTASRSRIDEVREISEAAMERSPTSDVDAALAGVSPLREPTDLRVRDRCLATTDAERYAEARERCSELSVEIVENAREVADLARGYATVIALDESFAGMEIDGDVRVQPDALDQPTSVVPERTLAFFATNRERLLAAIDVHRAAGLDEPTDLEELEATLERIDEDGIPIGDEELDRLRTAAADLDAAVGMAANVANDHLRSAIRERDVTIEGSDLLSMVEQGAGVDSLLAHELRAEFEEAVIAARSHLIDALALRDDEASMAEAVFPDTPTFPVEPEDAAVARLRESIQADRDRRAMRAKQEMAMTLSEQRTAAEIIVRQSLELDVELAIARFAERYACTMPTFGGEGIDLQDGRSPLLDVPLAEVEAVTYDVEDVVLLSGVNSGGKTALLDLLAVTVVLAHMGLPVPGEEVRLQRFDGLHYYAATQGTLDAGAFESTLREFGTLVTQSGDRLVLVDELESITEPGAAANIVAGILEELEGETTAVIVSHLAAEIREVAGSWLRVDGIEASEVVDGELVVDRSPVKGYLARSTPELIVERLVSESTDDRAAFYKRLLEKFE